MTSSQNAKGSLLLANQLYNRHICGGPFALLPRLLEGITGGPTALALTQQGYVGPFQKDHCFQTGNKCLSFQHAGKVQGFL